MARVNVQIPVASDHRDVLPWSQQRLLNLYPEIQEAAPTKTPHVLKATEGLVEWADTQTLQPIRGMILGADGLVYAVSDRTLHSFDNEGTKRTMVGEVIDGSGPVSMAYNPTQICIITETGNQYVCGYGGLIEKNPDADYLESQFVVVMDGHGILLRKDSDEFILTSLDDFRTIDPLDFATAEKRPDKLVSAAVLNDNLWLFGEETTEVWFNSGNADFPFARTTGGSIPRGCAARFSVKIEDNAVFWLGDDGTVYRGSGPTPQRISTHGIEEHIRTMTDITDAIGFIYTLSGHKFYVLNFPTGERTLVYDIATGAWHERSSGTTYSGAWNMRHHVFAYRKNLVGGLDGKIYRLDPETYTEAGSTIVREAVAPVLHGGTQNRVTMAAFEIDIDGGQGVLSGQGSDPEIMLAWSDDGGRTYGTDRAVKTGERGVWRRKARTYRLGSFYERHMRIRYSDPTAFSILGASAEIEAGYA